MVEFRVGPTGFELVDGQGTVMEVPAARDLGPVHFLGIAGIGMSGIARIMLSRGIRVSGSDAKELPVLEELRALGATVGVGFDSTRLDGVATVVASSAIRPDNVELVAARELGLRVLHRSQALASVMRGWRGVAVAGTNGKTTTTSMVVELLRHAGLDPSFAIGGELVSAGTNGADGSGDIFVAEADESDASFLVYPTTVSVVTNVQPDHLDHYGTPAAVEAAFDAFAQRLGTEGTLVTCLDDPGARALAKKHTARGGKALTVGRIQSDNAAEHPHIAIHDTGVGQFELHESFEDSAPIVLPVRLSVPGAHNVLNAACAYAAARALGVDPEAAVAGVEAFSGARRRFEFRGLTTTGVRIYDDYAHNPPKVAAAVATAREVADAAGSRVIAVFQPHLYSRTRDFAREFGEALTPADEVVLMDVYGAREDPMPGISGRTVLDQVGDTATHYAATPEEVLALVPTLVQGRDVVVTIGAGDVTALSHQLLSLLGRPATAPQSTPQQATAQQATEQEVTP